MPQDRVPSATALCINKSNVDLITKGNLSHYELQEISEGKLKDLVKNNRLLIDGSHNPLGAKGEQKTSKGKNLTAMQ